MFVSKVSMQKRIAIFVNSVSCLKIYKSRLDKFYSVFVMLYMKFFKVMLNKLI